ncbi:putative ribonuclease H-like domain-containing protein [Tanacetum coccineum]
MTGNMSYLSDFKEFDGGYVTFGGGAKGGRTTGKGTLKTGKLDFEDVYFVKELQFNLFTDESQVLLKVPRKNNMYSVDMKNIVPKESLTCLMMDSNSKAFRVYNIRTRKVEENLHIRFLEDKPIIIGDGPKWLFDIDVLTKLMNYVPVVAGTNLLQNASNDETQPSGDAGKKDDEGVSQESGIDDQERPKNITTAPLEATHANFFGDETELDMSNITTTYLVPSTPNTRIHKDHSLDHVIGDVQSGVQTRRMTKTSNEQGFISVVYEGKTHEDLHTCLFACFLSQVEPKKVIQTLTDPSWIEAMQDELLQFKLQKVWTLVDLPYGKRAIRTKWVYKNKKDERGIVIRNKARLVA